jgi:hypothetical protein
MVRADFDDSGTHSSSAMTVLGGLMGTCAQWDRFELGWAAKLANPHPECGKPALSMFHLSACNARDGEFVDYSDAEQDAVIHDFRRIVIDAGLISTAIAVDRRAWDELIIGERRVRWGDSLERCFEQCLNETAAIAGAHADGAKVAVVFDQGIQTARLRQIGLEFTLPLGVPRFVTVSFGSVIDILPLQGADIVATENYWHALDWLKLGDDALPRPHLRHYLTNMLHEGFILDRGAIERLSVLDPAEEVETW